ncbi:flavodoxin [Oscillospiraceae bacterium HV4-5-C5C]|nr:flavodoxin [Oscillospiraceae bacterium HV4-5-C5C]
MSKIMIVYWSGTGNTEAMAQAIADGVNAAGQTAECCSVDEADATAVLACDKIAFGCPAMGAEVLEEDSFEPFFAGLESQLSGKKVALFGSYGWGDGEWMRNWAERTRADGAELLDDGLIQNGEADVTACQAYGKSLAGF